MNKNSISKAISALLVLLLCVGVFAVIAQFTNGFKEDFKTFYLTYKNENIMSANTKRFLSPNEEHRFDVIYTFEFLDENEEAQTDYNVKIVSNVEKGNEFTFTVNGETKEYTDGIDLSKAFDLQKYDTYFTLMIPEGDNLQSILESVYGGTVAAPGLNDLASPYLYTLVVSSYDESVTYNIDFAFGTPVAEIKLDKTEVVF